MLPDHLSTWIDAIPYLSRNRHIFIVKV